MAIRAQESGSLRQREELWGMKRWTRARHILLDDCSDCRRLFKRRNYFTAL
jgi:hypothetical protein